MPKEIVEGSDFAQEAADRPRLAKNPGPGKFDEAQKKQLKDRSNVRVIITVKKRGTVTSMYDVRAGVKVGDKKARIANVGSSNTPVGAIKMAHKAKADLVEKGIPADNIKIKGP